MTAVPSDILDSRALGAQASGAQPILLPRPVSGRSDGLIPVRVAPLVSHDSEESGAAAEKVTETVMDMQLIVDYTNALAKRTAANIQADNITELAQAHEHPQQGAACLRCSILGSSRNLTLGTTLLEILARTNADEEWNHSQECTDTKIISRLKRLVVSAASLKDIYGPYWGPVMLTCLRIEAADFALLHHLTQKYQHSKVLTVHTREALAAYHLAMVTCPFTSTVRGTANPMLRSAVAVRLATATAMVAVGKPPAWLDHLPAPVL
ncbi:hypothetical protein [Mycobacteroides abscessus]|uniref:Uncharacterized protein n=1 Tax=Mycobacteroides abscessus subsp. massiliense TaxID=1962118 RepID=A0A1U0X9U2_9MYCO|nr:hypothetical protein [Mycobacteroides abscessus]SKM34459.1 Uncharacterised protein [Mycobacteroides abscessus subsp. massiliense]SKT38710.1 Uncharacterised protein [Mycobacteroides abscessus subsp. massiliense]SKT85151.1 Uncharacterised protein [Mycobacteroides abscessus subsp. massiliense]SKX26649.1 Uncharacterised protein [Mycobacteroides abscessus subsp. massiliense]